VPSWYIVPALLCGNSVVWKPAEYTPETGKALTSLLQAGGLPEGVLNTVLADGEATFSGLEQALDDGLVDKVGFTGSSAVGARIGELCGRHLQSPCLELGGKNPLVVMPDADLDLAVEGALFSGFGTAGQRCTSMGTAIVHESVYDDFLARFTRAAEGAVVGDPFGDVLYGPMINQRFADRFEEWLELIEDHHEVSGSTGTGRITADNPRAGFDGDPDAGLYYHPTIAAGVTSDDALYSTETFGPLVGVARFGDFDQAVELANGHGYGLSAAIYTSDAAHALRFRQRVSAGMLSVNNSTSGAEAHLPFGGNGKSGNGSRLSGIWVLDQFTRWQSMNWDYAGKLQKAQMDVDDVEADLDFRLP
jgi:aldehyde dehydrogenase (NAD+)